MSENFRELLKMLPDYLGQHLILTVIALGVGIAVSLPLSVLVVRHPRPRWAVLTVAGVIQTVPSLALLSLILLITRQFGFLPTIIGLTLYSMMPILRNTITGILEVDPTLTEVATGIGMTPRQVLFRVELPIAMPVIIAGIRTATVWVVGLAIISTLIGQPSLGNYIFSGVQTQNWTSVHFGWISAASLAILLDFLIGLLEKGVRGRSPRKIGMAIAGLAILVGGGLTVSAVAGAELGSGREGATGGPRQGRGLIRVAAKSFTEQYILAELIGERLVQNGFQVQKVEGLGSAIAFNSLRDGDIDCYADYTGTIWATFMKQKDTPRAGEALTRVSGWLEREHDIVCLGPLGFENTYVLAMRREQAERLGIRTIEDLARHAPRMKVASDLEFFSRPEWFKLRDSYHLKFDELVSLDSTFMYEAVAKGNVDVISGYSVDGRIADFDLVTLEDTHHAIPPYDTILLLRRETLRRPGVVEALRPLIGSISVEAMGQANLMVDRTEDKKTVPEAAAWLKGKLKR